MLLIRKDNGNSIGLGPSFHAPIAKALHVLPEETKAHLRVKFDIHVHVAHFNATEKLAFTKYAALSELEAHHGVSGDTSYTTVDAGTV